jgi:hypothetical protein
LYDGALPHTSLRFVIFTRSVASDGESGNAHFLRGTASELIRLHHKVEMIEPACEGLESVHDRAGKSRVDSRRAYPMLSVTTVDEAWLDLSKVLEGADVVLVSESCSRDLIARVGEHHRKHPAYRLYLHDSGHTESEAHAAEIRHYDGVLVPGNSLRNIYLRNTGVENAVTWYDAADTRVYRPLDRDERNGDLVWVGEWGDEERQAEIREFLINPVKTLSIKARVYGNHFPTSAVDELRAAGIEYGGTLPGYQLPEVYARYRVTVYLPKRTRAARLPGIPEICVFEALACGIPLVSAPWRDTENLFHPGRDFLFAGNGEEMADQIRAVLSDGALRDSLIWNGLETIRSRHTCAHRAKELFSVVAPRAMAAQARVIY